jgi:adenylate cyclase
VELILSDARTRAQADFDPARRPPIQLVLLDQPSLDWAREELAWGWPWYREAYARMLDYLRADGARAVGFDVLFTEPSVHGQPDDQALADALARFPNTVLAAVPPRAGGAAGAAEAEPRWSAWPGPVLGQPAPDFAVGGASIPLLSTQAWNGLANGLPERDGVFRRALLAGGLGGRTVASLGAALAALAPPEAGVDWTSLARAADAEGGLTLRFHGDAQAYAPWSAAALLQSALRAEAGEPPVIPAGTFRGQWVLLGFSAPGLLDLRPTPLSAREPGVMLHATLLHNLWAGDWFRPAPAAVGAWLAGISALLGAAGVVFSRRASSGLIALLIAPLAPFAVAWGLSIGNWQVPAVPALMASLVASAAGLALNYAAEGRQKAFLKSAFQHYLSPAVIEDLLREPGQLRLGGERRELTLFFSDLEGFSSFSERLPPERLTALLNAFLTEMTDILLESGGTVDKYIGDAIVAFWNAPTRQPDHARRAIRAALAAQSRLAERRGDWRAEFGVELRLRIGLHTGEVVVGNLGSARRFDYSVLGDAANLASRLEGVNKAFGTYLLLSETTAAQAGQGIPMRDLGAVQVVGRAQAVRVFTAGAEPPGYAAALARLRAGDLAGAAEAFSALADDPAAVRTAAACRVHLEAGRAWDGVWRPTEK